MSDPSVVTLDVKEEVWKRTVRSYWPLLIATVLLLVSLLVLWVLHQKKEQADRYAGRRYMVKDELVAKLTNNLGPLTPQPGSSIGTQRFATTADLFDELYRESRDAEKKREAETKLTAEKKREAMRKAAREAARKAAKKREATNQAADQTASQDRGDEVEVLTAEIRDLLDNDPTDNSKNAPLFASLAYARAAALLKVGSADPATLAAEKAKMKRYFDALDPEELTRDEPELFPRTGKFFNELMADVFDEKHPAHAGYEVVWYSALVFAVLSLVYIVFVPIFRLLPFGGDQDAMKRFEDMFAQKTSGAGVKGMIGAAARSTMQSGLSLVSGVVISAVAVGSTAVNASSSPGVPFTDIGIEQVAPVGEVTGSTTQTTVPSNTNVKDPNPTAPTTTSVQSPLVTPPVVPPVKQDKQTTEGPSGVSASDLERLKTELSDETAEKVSQAVSNLASKEYVDTRLSSFDWYLDTVVEGAETRVGERMKKVDGRVDGVSARTMEGALAEPRPGVISRVAGFDRYRVTQLAVEAVAAEFPKDQKPSFNALNAEVASMTSAGPLSKTAIGLRLENAIAAAVRGPAIPNDQALAIARELVHRAKPLIIALSHAEVTP